MIIEMPFLHRLCSATNKSPEPREMAAWDMERLQLEDVSKSDFEPGANLGDKATFILGGQHWASLVSAVLPRHVRHDPEVDKLTVALSDLAYRIDCSRFFAEGRAKLPQTSILSKTPKSEYIRNSQREVNVANLSAWVHENLVSVDGEVFARVREPTVSMDIVGPFYAESCYITIQAPGLSPASASEDHGLLSTISGRNDLLDLARGLLSSDGRMLRIDNKIEIGAFQRMHSTIEDASDMAARSVVALAKRMARNRYECPPKLFSALSKAFKKRGQEFDEDSVDHLASLLAESVGEIKFPMSLMTTITLDCWHVRPITLGIGNQVPLAPGPR
ncbi:hypothetical protein OIU34_18455 [Pararhizobium sp. BT-229]|uniref:hypothetical protein n=1 Tax=Pararhizobium sp. BT-229 TaxID=2986923 RepID=UPI0021F78817|nr:hypothetical protein [Pararhizobium sp. BT-229]MCV9963861.1 hypothetical protein [Pararhizobium sp. BT-229]